MEVGAGTTVSLSLILSLISVVGVVVGIFGSYKRDNETERKKEVEIEKNFAKISVKLDEFARQLSEMLKRAEKSSDKMDEVSKEITKQNERISSLFHYKDEHERRLNEIEERLNEVRNNHDVRN